MSHLDTAYQLGMKQAEADFNLELQKAAQPVTGPTATTQPMPVKPPAPVRAPGTATPPPAPPGVVNPGANAGMKNRGY